MGFLIKYNTFSTACFVTIIFRLTLVLKKTVKKSRRKLFFIFFFQYVFCVIICVLNKTVVLSDRKFNIETRVNNSVTLRATFDFIFVVTSIKYMLWQLRCIRRKLFRSQRRTISSIILFY